MFNKFFNNLINSINGLKFVLKEHFFISLKGPNNTLYFVLDIKWIFKLIIIVVYFFLLAFELLNTAIVFLW